jgi:lipoyl(octanoyl) transferase
MNILVFAYSDADAVGNMAFDRHMLDCLSPETPLIFRFYGWKSPAFTFGYTQRWCEVKQRIPTGIDCCRRPTGGGVVDHRNDWTYALAVASSVAWARQPPLLCYRELHACMVRALENQGVESELSLPNAKEEAVPFACFDAPSPFDVVGKTGFKKIAGAALKRTREGLLFQGTVSRDELPDLDWVRFREQLIETLVIGILGSEVFIVNQRLPFLTPYQGPYAEPGWNLLR